MDEMSEKGIWNKGSVPCTLHQISAVFPAFKITNPLCIKPSSRFPLIQMLLFQHFK